METPPIGDATPRPRTARRRALRIAGWSLGGFALFIIVTIAVGWWVLGRETTLQRIVVEAEKRLGGQLRIEGVSGSIYDRVAFDRLTFRSKTQVITVEHGSLRYRLEPFDHRFTIADARAGKVAIQTIAKSTEPVVEPDTLALPSAMRISTLLIDSLHVDTLEFVDENSKIALSAADLKGRYATEGLVKRWTIEQVALTTPWGHAKGSGRIDATKPFALQAKLQAEGRIADITYNAPVDVAGRLGDLTAASEFTVSDPTNAPLVGHADARVLPFRDQPLAAANLRVADLVPKRWKASLPDAAITIDAAIRPRLGTTRIVTGETTGTNPFTGTLHGVNARPGALDRDRIPLAAFDAELHGDSLGIVIDALKADLGAAGRVAGKGAYVFADGGTPSFDGNVAALDLRAIDGKLIPSRFAGPIAVSRRGGVTRLDTELSDTARRVRIRGELAGDEVRLAEADVTVGGSRLQASGKVDLAKERPFEVAGTTTHLDPHDFGNFARADLNTTFRLAGSLGTASGRTQIVAVRADVRIDPSRVVDRPLVGTVAGRVEGAIDASPRQGQPAFALRAVDAAHVALTVGANRVSADGDFGRPQDHLSWTVDAPKLSDLAIGLSGRLTGNGVIGGTANDPSLVFTVAGDDLRYAASTPGATTATTAAAKTPANAQAVSAAKVATNAYSVRSIRGNGRFAGSGGAVAAEITLADYRDGSGTKAPVVQSARLQVEGTRDAHRLTVSASSDRFDFSGAASGGLDANSVWRGRIDRLANQGRVPLALSAPTNVVVSRDRVEVGAADLQFDQGALHLDRFDVVDGRVATAGRATGFPLTLVGAFSRDFATRVSTSLKFGAEWDLRVGDAVDGKLRVFRESGNVTFLTAPRFDVDPDRLEVDATIVADRLSATIGGSGRGLGRIDASLATRLSKRDGQWGVAGDAPLEVKSDVDVPDVRWLARLSGISGLDVTGALKLAVTGRGTVARPLLAGHASGDAIGLRWPDQGLNARDGHLDLDFDGDRVVLGQATLLAGKGRLDASGDLRLVDRDVSGVLNVKFDRFEAVSRTDRTMVVSGSGALKFGSTGIDVTADVRADRGSLQLAQRRGPTLSTDIVVVGRDDDDATTVPARNVPVRFDVKFDMGDDFKVKGSGFDGKLGGTIRIAGTGADLRAIGTVAVREGTYEGYGQQLTIDRGNLNFSGPIDNPSLDIYAVRKNLAVEAGVQVTGTALAPQAKLVSTPNVPDTEKLSWLVLGHGLAASNKSDYGQLATAAAGLLGSSDSTSIQSRIAATLGVDEIGVSGFGGDKGGLLTVGKQISSRLRVSLEQGFTHAATLVKLRYNVYKQIDLQVATGTESSIDVFYTFSFD